MSEEIKETYLKLPNVTVGELQDVVDFMEDNDIEYIEFYEKDLKQQIEDLQQKVEQLEKENKKQKEIIENLTTMTVCGDKNQIKNTAQYKLEQLENIIKEAIEYIKKNLTIGSILDGEKTYCLNSYSFDYEYLLNILKKGE